ncbi:hypothetical protein DRO27_00460 [Candidatus Bathyarchaeota archaeon]|nr:MAG: hypothetical protein DRO27_00460 [Candidatus Bathyarchaeota archaeon]
MLAPGKRRRTSTPSSSNRSRTCMHLCFWNRLNLIVETGNQARLTASNPGFQLPGYLKPIWKSQNSYHQARAGCEKEGGPPDCAIRVCAKEKGYELCNECDELVERAKFDWLGDYSKVLKGKLIDYKGKTKAQIAAEALKSV